MDSSEESPDVDGLKLFEGHACYLPEGLKIPHMGWNTISVVKENPLLDEKMNGAWVYYVHSYYAPVGTDTIATTEYGNGFSAALQKNNFFATQFHPEKSGAVGEHVLKNFVEL